MIVRGDIRTVFRPDPASAAPLTTEWPHPEHGVGNANCLIGQAFLDRNHDRTGHISPFVLVLNSV